jgi:hypothetical protein
MHKNLPCSLLDWLDADRECNFESRLLKSCLDKIVHQKEASALAFILKVISTIF